MRKKEYRYIIYSPGFNENEGGAIVLHCLCDLLNKRGYKSCIYPLKPQFSRKKIFITLKSILNYHIKKLFGIKFKFFDDFITPLCTDIDPDNDIIIYPEIVLGNPLGGKNIVRWLLNEPGFFLGEFVFNKNDLFFYYQKAFQTREDIKNIGGELKVVYLQSVYKNMGGNKRAGSCYSLRKGKDRKIVHDLENSVLIDGLSHADVAQVFNKSEVFISYDLYTMYSRYAAACGCLSVVIPKDGVDKFMWRPEEELRKGIAYGFNDLEWAKNTQDQVLPSLTNNVKKLNRLNVDNFIKQCELYFDR